jgi:hypothetical protein
VASKFLHTKNNFFGIFHFLPRYTIYIHLLTWLGFGLIGYVPKRLCTNRSRCRRRRQSAHARRTCASRRRRARARCRTSPPAPPAPCPPRPAPIRSPAARSRPATPCLSTITKHHHYCVIGSRVIHTYHSRFNPEGVAGVSQIFIRDTHVLPKLVTYEKHCRRDRW